LRISLVAERIRIADFIYFWSNVLQSQRPWIIIIPLSSSSDARIAAFQRFDLFWLLGFLGVFCFLFPE
jgi:hypothetical protein